MVEIGETEKKLLEPMKLDQIQQFIKENIIPSRNGRRCVDGRYEVATEDSGTIARAGGDLGYAMVLLALGLSPEKAFERVYTVVTKNGGQFSLHTDHHADPEGSSKISAKIGCGHASKPTDPNLAAAFDLDPAKMTELVSYVKQKSQEDPKVKMTNLNGEHRELGVIVVKGKTKTINPQNNEGVQFFVYDQDRDEEFMQQLVTELNLPGIDFEQFKKVADLQLQATLRNLALGKTIYQFNADDPELRIEQLGVVA